MTSTPPIRRRWIRFSLRSILVLMVVVAVPLAWKFNRVRAQQKAIWTIQEAGGSVRYRSGRVWLNSLLGEGFAEVVGVSLGDRSNAKVFEVLSQLPGLTGLDVRSESIPDDAFEYLKKCPRLKYLIVYFRKSSDPTSYRRLEALPECEVLFLPDPDG